MSLLREATKRALSISTVDDYAKAVADSFAYGGVQYPVGAGPTQPMVEQTLGNAKAEPIPDNFTGLIRGTYKANGVVFACMQARQLGFESVRFTWQRLSSGKPSEMFTTPALELLHRPWRGGTTQDLLARVIQDADLAGNAFWTRIDGELVRLRPDWVTVVSMPRMAASMLDQNRLAPVGDWQRIGYVYVEGGDVSRRDPVWLPVEDVAHFAPIPDPESNMQVGMSWLTPILREIQADGLMTRHRRKYFENGATPNMVIKHTPGAQMDAIKRFAEQMASEYAGVENAYRMMHLYPGADATVVGNSLEQIQFEAVQAAGELRIANAARVPATVVGLMKGVETSSYNNWRWARRSFSDQLLHPLWQNAAGSFETLVDRDRAALPGASGVRLWYDPRDIPLLREDAKEASEIGEIQARTIRAYVDGGFTAESAKKAVMSNDLDLLVHTGMLSVQLQTPGADTTAPLQGSNDGQA